MGRLRIAFLLVALAPLARAQKPTDVRVDEGTPPGSLDSYFVELTASGPSVYAAWYDSSFHGQGGWNRSKDGGATWLPAAQALPGATTSSTPQFAAVGPVAYMLTPASFDGTWDVFFQRSLDRGDTWSAPLVLNGGPPSSNGSGACIAAVGSAVYAVYTDDRDGAIDLYFNRSLDGGSTWLATDVRIDTGDALGSHHSTYATLAATERGVFVAWWDERDALGGRDLYFNGSLDRGTTWLPSAVRLGVGTPGQVNTSLPVLAAIGPAVFTAWTEDGELYFDRSLDGGAHWLASPRHLDGGSPGVLYRAEPMIAAVPSPRLGRSAAPLADVYVSWISRVTGAHLGDLYCAHSSDSGTTWPAPGARVNTSSAFGEGDVVHQRLAVAGPTVYLAWWDRALGETARLNRSLDRGTTWLTPDVRINRGPAGGSATWVALAVSGGSVYMAYDDGRNDIHQGRRDIYFNLALGHQPYGDGLAGSGGFVPRLACVGSPSIGRRLNFDVSEGLGGASAVIGLSVAGPAAIPFNGGTMLVQPPLIQLPLVLGGASGVPGDGAGTVPAVIPNTLGLIGTRWNTQAFVLDAGAPVGMSLSAAIESWIL